MRPTLHPFCQGRALAWRLSVLTSLQESLLQTPTILLRSHHTSAFFVHMLKPTRPWSMVVRQPCFRKRPRRYVPEMRRCVLRQSTALTTRTVRTLVPSLTRSVCPTTLGECGVRRKCHYSNCRTTMIGNLGRT